LDQQPDLFSGQDTSPDPFEEVSDADEHHHPSPSNLRKKSDQSSKSTISVSMSNLTMTGLQKSTVVSYPLAY
jgi:hypothetical protein